MESGERGGGVGGVGSGDLTGEGVGGKEREVTLTIWGEVEEESRFNFSRLVFMFLIFSTVSVLRCVCVCVDEGYEGSAKARTRSDATS